MPFSPRYPHLRQSVRDSVLRADTAELCNEADFLLREYLAVEPDDDGMRMLGSGLYRMRDALRLVADGRGSETDPAKLTLPRLG